MGVDKLPVEVAARVNTLATVDKAPQSGLGRGRLAVSADLTIDNSHAGLTVEMSAASKTITFPNGTLSDGSCYYIEATNGVPVFIACAGTISGPTGSFGGTGFNLEANRTVILQASTVSSGAYLIIGGTSVVAAMPRDAVATLTDQSTIATNCATASTFDVTLTASRNMGSPSNMTNGQRCVWRIKQGGTGSYVITWNAVFSFSTTVPSPTLSTAVGTTDLVGAIYNSAAAKWNVCAVDLGHT